MEFSLRPMSAADVEEMRDWHYPEPYHGYDLDPEGDELAAMLADLDAGDHWFAVIDGSDDLVGFFEFTVNKDGEEVEIGLGLRPDLTGRGLGVGMIEVGLDHARARWSPVSFALDVFPWNDRAIRAYEKVGFVRGEVYTRRFDDGGERRFLRMTCPASGPTGEGREPVDLPLR